MTTLNNKVTAMNKLAEIETWLPANQFSRVHRSYIVNLAQVQAVEKGQVYLKNEKIIPIGRQYKEHFMASLQRLTINGRQ
ncbi:LytR/AlgR family response regulator transcription factor [Mucilaginibacter sp. P25]|uniref:LytR/AlgR family response regulator transcription factor n=1 Tax=Mucilaginibacter sp. P25 TaxID=3423945 RepID=UPI003D7A3202